MEWLVPAVVVVLLGAGAVLQRRLARLRAAAREAWPAVERQIQVRHELVSALVHGVRADLPAPAWGALLRARDRAAAVPAELAEIGRAEAALTAAVQSLLALGLAHAALRSDAVFLRSLAALRMQATDMDAAWAAFNAAALDYNAARRRMPAALVAATLNFHPIPSVASATSEGPIASA